MTVSLSPGTTPSHSIPRSAFFEHVEDDTYWSVPLEYFNTDTDPVTLDSQLAAELDWTIDEDCGDRLNIAAVAQTVSVDGNNFAVNPGFFCSYIDTDALEN